MKEYLDKIQQMEQTLADMKKNMTLQQGTQTGAQQDGNMGAAEAATGNVNYEKENFSDEEEGKDARRKMLMAKMDKY